MSAEQKIRVGVDIGGTKVAYGLVNAEDKIISEIRRFEVARYEEAEALVHGMVEQFEALLSDHDCRPDQAAGLGVGTPGPLDLETGTVLNTPNMPIFRDFGLKAALREAADMPVELNNDANVFVLGEALAGQAQDGEIVLGVTLGTGFGCGLVQNKRIYVGATGTAAEIATCPYRDAYLEDYVSGRGLSMMYEQRTGEKVHGPELARRAAQDEPAAIEAFREFGGHVGSAFAWFVNLLDPDFIVVGGSIAKDWQYIVESVHQTMYEYINPKPTDHLKIVRSELGESAAIIGAAGLLR